MSDQDTVGKLPLSGLVDMGNIGFYDQGTDPAPLNLGDISTLAPSTFGGVVVNVTWSELQQTANGSITCNNEIDQALTLVENYNSANNTNIGIKLRVWGGYAAPDWAKNIDGPPISVPGKNSDPSETVGRFWTSDYIAAWTTFENELAAKYDSNPLIREVAVTSGAMATDEPFVQPQGDQVAALKAAGYSDVAEERVLLGAATDYSAWTETPLDYTFNLFHEHDGPQDQQDQTFTLTAMQQAANSPHETYLANHALNGSDNGTSDDNFVYAQIDADLQLDPAPHDDFQTASPKQLAPVGPDANWDATVASGVTYGGSSIELWPGSPSEAQQGGFTTIQGTLVENLATIMAAGVVPPNAGGTLGLIAPALATGDGNAVAFTGYQSVLLASDATSASFTVSVASGIGAALYANNAYANVAGMGSSTLTITGGLAQVDTALAGLAELFPGDAASDTLTLVVNGGTAGSLTRDLGVVLEPPAAPPAANVPPPTGATPEDAGAAWTNTGTVTVGPPGSGVLTFDAGSTVTIGGDLDIGTTGSGLVSVGGANTDVTVTGNLTVGADGAPVGTGGVLLAALAALAQDTARLQVGGTLAVQGNGALDLTGTLEAGAVQIAQGGLVNANGWLGADGSLAGQQTIVNDGSIAVAADANLGVTKLTLGALTGTGALGIGAGATLALLGGVGQGQTVTFAPNSQAQFSTAPSPVSQLVLDVPALMQGTIAGFSFADDLVLQNFVAAGNPAYAGGVLTVSGSIVGGGSETLNLALGGDLAGDTPEATVTGDATHIQFVPQSQIPAVLAPALLHGVSGVGVPVLDIALLAPPSTAPTASTAVSVTVSAAGGTLLAGDDQGNVSVTPASGAGITISGTLGTSFAQNLAAVEQSLATLTYTAAGPGSDAITIALSDYAGSAAPLVIGVTNADAAVDYSWATPASGSFGDAANWTTPQGAPDVQPGGGDSVTLDAGVYTVAGNGAAGELDVYGTVTLTGTVQAAGSTGVTAKIDRGGNLLLATGAVLQSDSNLVLGQSGAGTLTLMDGSAAVGTATNDADMVLGATTGSTGTAVVESSLVVSRNLTVGDAGTGTLQVDDVAAIVIDENATVGGTGSGTVIVDAGYWDSSGTLTVGDFGAGTLAIEADANGRTGQVTDENGVIAASSGSSGQVSVVEGAWLSTGTLAIGAGGSGTLAIGADGSVSVSVDPNTGGGVATSSGLITLGGASGSAGTVAISDGGALTGAADMDVGTAGGSGLLQIGLAPGDSGFVAVTGTFMVGANGTVQLDGAARPGGQYGADLNAAAVILQSGAALAGAGVVGGLANGSGAYALVPVVNDGSITAEGGTLLLYGDVSGTGTLAITPGATLEVTGSVASGQTVRFAAPSATLALDDPQDFTGEIRNFAPGDVIALPGLAYSEAGLAGGELTLLGASPALTLALPDANPNAIMLASDQHGGTLVELACFARGTRIRTPSGETKIEHLRAGDSVTTASGATRPIRWIGWRHVDCSTHPNPAAIMPIRVRADAFAAGVPARDLLLSPDHAIFAEGVLIPVKCLLNGTSVARVQLPEVTYFHLELDEHDIVLAEGLATESYLDTGNRTAFANAALVSLHARFDVTGESAFLAWEAAACAPLRVTGPELRALRQRLATRAGTAAARRLPVPGPHATFPAA